MQNVFQPLSRKYLVNNSQTLLQFTLFLLLSVMTSCSSVLTKNNSSEISKQISYAQIEGEGRGRIFIKGQKYLFNFATAVEQTDSARSWILELEFPLYGSEYLSFEWQKGKLKIKGSFLGALRKFARESHQKDLGVKEMDELLKVIAGTMGFVLEAKLDESIHNCVKTMKCNLANDSILYWKSENEQELTAFSPSKKHQKNIAYSINFSQLKNETYKLLSLTVRGDQGFSKQKDLMELNLYFD